MPVKIRLARIGRKKMPFHRIVAIDSRKKRDGQFLDDLGTYNTLKGEIVTFKEDLFKDWVSKGAVVSDTVKRIFRQYKKQTEQPAEKVVKKVTASKAKKASAPEEKKNDAAA